MNINILSGEYIQNKSIENEMKKYQEEYPFTLDHFQNYSLEKILLNENILTCVPTGSGKTLVAELGSKKTLQEGKKIIYNTPIKTLSNQKFLELTKKFPNHKIGIMTGDIKMHPDADVIIMTTEIVRNLLYQKKNITEITEDSNELDKLSYHLNIYKDVGLVIFDEVII